MATERSDDVRGLCDTMCPIAEVRMREKNNLLHYFEMVPGTERDRRPRANYDWMVKEYTRSAAGKEDARPRELRPLKTLLKTVDYLIEEIVPRRDRPWNFVYDFLFDRLRAVRRDMVIQRLTGPVAATILEKIVRFHIYSGYRLCSEPMSKFDPKINDTHIQESLKRLLVLYDEIGTTSQDNMAEFVSIYLLYNLGRTEALLYGYAHRHILSESKDFALALEASSAALLGNYVRVFRLCRRLSVLYKCAASRHLPQLQNEALQKMAAAFHSRSLRFNTTNLRIILNYDDEKDVDETCQTVCLNVNEKGVLFDKTAYKQIDKIPLRKYRFIEESLLERSIPDLICSPLNQPGIS